MLASRPDVSWRFKACVPIADKKAELDAELARETG